MSDATQTEKEHVRREVVARRDALSRDAREAASNAVSARPFPLRITPGLVVSGFMPLKNEINPLPLMRKLGERGAQLALPAIIGRGKPLAMRAWAWGDPVIPGVWGIREPKPDAAEVEPDILLVPLVAFDRAGHRVGYGAGYYDLTLVRLRAGKQITAVGLAFAVQEIPGVPTTKRDARLDLVLTEKEIIDFR